MQLGTSKQNFKLYETTIAKTLKPDALKEHRLYLSMFLEWLSLATTFTKMHCGGRANHVNWLNRSEMTLA